MKNLILSQKLTEETGLDLNLYLNMRWIAFIGQIISILLLVKLSTQPILWQGLIPFMASFMAGNLYIHLEKNRIKAHDKNRFMPETQSILMLILDTLQVAGMVAVLGGLKNPFFIYIAAPTVIAASLLSLKATIILAATAFLSIIAVGFVATTSQEAALAVLNEWDKLLSITAFVIMLVYLALFLNPLTKHVAQHKYALRISENMLRDQREVFKIAAVAAAVAHELGSPLTTITITAKELERDLTKNNYSASSQTLDDIKILQDQAKKCQKLLKEISFHTDITSSHLMPERIGEAINECVAECCSQLPESKNKNVAINDLTNNQILKHDADLYFAICNIIKNALSFAKKEVKITIKQQTQRITINIEDDGPGFAKKYLERSKIPFHSVRSNREHHLGLGLFIANIIVASLKGKITIANKTKEKGAIVTLSLQKL